MNQMNQKNAVFAALCAVFAVQHFETKVEPSKERRAQVNAILFESFKAGKVEYDGQLPDDTKLKSYISGLQSNWLRKDKRLNGGVTYVAKNPGSRAGSGDASVIAMRRLLATKTDNKERAEIQRHIDSRLATIKPPKDVTIDVSALPEELRHLAPESDET